MLIAVSFIFCSYAMAEKPFYNPVTDSHVVAGNAVVKTPTGPQYKVTKPSVFGCGDNSAVGSGIGVQIVEANRKETLGHIQELQKKYGNIHGEVIYFARHKFDPSKETGATWNDLYKFVRKVASDLEVIKEDNPDAGAWENAGSPVNTKAFFKTLPESFNGEVKYDWDKKMVALNEDNSRRKDGLKLKREFPDVIKLLLEEIDPCPVRSTGRPSATRIESIGG